ncbi:NfeD family protein [Oceanobacter kriegii]|uniref:NfeD family protein n=1 Tax=Oceanobacter kriegii TaxID=64972 RepID=UPI0003FBDEBC|nr:NfeD family protein [Oceanobacter kriegii]
MEFISSHMSQSLLVLGIVALIIEVGLLGFSSIVLFFAGISLCVNGLLMMFGVLPETLTAALWSNAILITVLAVLLWKPFKRLQDNRAPDKLNSDFARDAFVLNEDVHLNDNVTRKYSGIEWKLKSEQPLAAGTRVRVDRTEVGVMWVVPLEQ